MERSRKFSPKNQTSNLWFIYGKEGCPFCSHAKEALKKRNIKFIYKNGLENIPEINRKMTDSENTNKIENFNTWPRIFHNKQFIGGFSHLEAYLKENNS